MNNIKDLNTFNIPVIRINDIVNASKTCLKPSAEDFSLSVISDCLEIKVPLNGSFNVNLTHSADGKYTIMLIPR